MRKKSLTLAELIVASILMGVVVVSPIAFELFIRRQYNIQVEKIKLVNEANSVLENVVKYMLQGIGDAEQTAINIVASDEIEILRDANGNGIPDDNVWAKLEQIGPHIRYYPDRDVPGTFIRITSQALHVGGVQNGLEVSANQSATTGVYRIDVTVRLAEKPDQTPDPLNNPSVEVTTFLTTNTSLTHP